MDWQTAIKATPEWQAGKLRIGTDGILEIADGQSSPSTTWYDCYPMLTKNVLRKSDLPEAVQNKIDERKALREKIK